MSCRSAVDLMSGAIGRLLPKLGEFLKQEHNLQTSMKEEIQSLETQLRRMDDALSETMSLAQQQYDRNCAYKLRELSYDIEDNIDNLLLSIDDASEPMVNYQDSIRETLEDIKARVKNLAVWHADFVAKRPTTSTVDPCLEDDGFVQVKQLVGINKLRAVLISRMSSSSQLLTKVSICAPGGMGKTTLAKYVYDNIKGEFDCSAFVSVGQQPNMKKALRDILIYIAKERYNDLNMTMLNEGQLVDELQHFLENKRFLIVIDDIRDIPSWKVIKGAVVDNGCGSRMIITSRVLNVAELSGEVRRMMPLSIDGSKELFYATLFGRKGTVNFDPLDDQTTEYIIKKCGRVPLAIIMIASLLAGKPQEEWTEVCNSIGFGHEDNLDAAENNTRKIIQFSYYDLPSHLKTCLLYLSIFPNGHVIEKDILVWRWVAEGFVHDDQEQGESVFKVGERYLYELVSRSMIQAVENEDTNICFCSVEGMVLDWIRTEAKEEKFVTVLSGDCYDHDDEHQSNNARIVAIQNRALDKYHDPARMWKTKVRSFNGIECHIYSSISLLERCRVLSLQGCKVPAGYSHDLKNLIAGLLHLRYLGLGGMDIQGNLNIEIGRLRYLQTLDLTSTYRGALPHGVTQLRQLKCLRFVAPRINLPNEMGNLTSLEELHLEMVTAGQQLNLFGKELSNLTELRVLRIHIEYVLHRTWIKAVLQSLSKLQKIEVVELCYIKHLSDFAKCLALGKASYYQHATAPGAFPKLRYMKMDTWLISQPGAMPQLKSVELEVHVRVLKDDANFDLHDFYKLSYLRLLEKVHVGINCLGAKTEEAEEVEAALRRAVQSHPNRPKLILSRVGRCVDDKQIRSFGGSGLAPQVIPLELLREITNDFSEKQRLGSGTFGTVYKGDLDGKEVAVKLLHSTPQRLDYEKDFMKEFENLSGLDHTNIVQLLGYCYEIKRICEEYEGKNVLADKIDRALCFDYMHNGSLQQHLDDESSGLDWQTHYKIIKGICEGLKYLHKGLENPMLHLDLKPGNILLDKNMVPKLADFGLSKFVCDNQTQATSSFLGTIRYCPPEHVKGNLFSNKFDIFSLGVVLIEIIAGSKGYDKTAEMPSQEFIDHVQENWRERMHQATPGCTLPTYECRQVQRCVEIALECVHPERTLRPNIEDIISRLNETENNTEKSATTSSSQKET